MLVLNRLILKTGLIRITNKYDFTNLAEFNFDWEVISDGSVLQSGKVPFLILNQKLHLI